MRSWGLCAAPLLSPGAGDGQLAPRVIRPGSLCSGTCALTRQLPDATGVQECGHREDANPNGGGRRDVAGQEKQGEAGQREEGGSSRTFSEAWIES